MLKDLKLTQTFMQVFDSGFFHFIFTADSATSSDMKFA